eukprot:GILI01000532.1.p2 GENE.GILI01000532.1~~GILI01000532.1.p2  ORF type:complete len:258 (-),score=85.08 GILI01000532.1:154-903(-)
MYQPHIDDDLESGKPYSGVHGENASNIASFNQMTRLGFIRKVYGILALQLLVTVAVTAGIISSESSRVAVLHAPGFMWAALAVSLVCIIALSCCPGVARQYPTNYILLGIFTLAESYLVGAVSATYNTKIVLLAFASTVAVVGGLSLYAWTTKTDFTLMGGILFTVLICFSLFGILCIFFPVLDTLYSCLGALLFSFYIIYDTQMILGNGKYNLSEEDYIFGALTLYLDIINLFLYILSIISKLTGGRD